MTTTSRPSTTQPTHTVQAPTSPRWGAGLWVGFVVAALLLLDVVELAWMGVIVPAAALGLAALQHRHPPPTVTWLRAQPDYRDLTAIGALYVAVVALFRVAFAGFGTDRVAGLFLTFAAGLLLGVVGPIVYTVWVRHRSLRDLGLGAHNLGPTLALGLVLAAVQFALTLWGYDLPEPVDWVPLLVMALVVGGFEAVFFRGFVQRRLEASFGAVPAIAGAAGLYSLYHVGYQMGADQLLFLFGLGAIYAIAFRLVDNVVVLWPLLTPLGALFNNLEAADIELPWASIAGFADVAALMAAAIWLARRHQRRTQHSLSTTSDTTSRRSPPRAEASTTGNTAGPITAATVKAPWGRTDRSRGSSR